MGGGASHRLDTAERILPYCGGGIAASSLFFGLTIAGNKNVSLYDGSLFDWSSDPARPMELGEKARDGCTYLPDTR